MTRAQEGYIDAYEILVQRHSAMAYRVALRLTGNHHDAQDVAQEALIAAWENLTRFRAGSSFSTWLYQIVTRRALNKVSRGRPASSLELLPDVADTAAEPAEQAERHLAVDAVTDALLALPFPQRVVIVLHHFEGLSWLFPGMKDQQLEHDDGEQRGGDPGSADACPPDHVVDGGRVCQGLVRGCGCVRGGR